MRCGELIASLPTRECGLKWWKLTCNCNRCSHSLRGSVDWNIKCICTYIKLWVTPYAGVWIEISESFEKVQCCLRHSLRGSVDWNDVYGGWKPNPYVTPYAGVWIEIFFTSLWNNAEGVTPYAGVWIEILTHICLYQWARCHSLRGSVDWNLIRTSHKFFGKSHSLRGSVDWNEEGKPILTPQSCHSLRGSVDWNHIGSSMMSASSSHSLRGSVDWNLYKKK